MVAMLPPRSIADSGGDRLRVWVKPRVPRDALIDDLKWHLKEEMAPLLEQVPKPLIHFYSYNETADDYLQQAPTRTLASNPNPAALKDAPGLESEHPLYWDYERMWPEPEK